MHFLLLVIFVLAICVNAAPIHTEAVSRGGNVTRDAQLEELGNVLMPGAMAYVKLGTYWFPHPRQTALRSEFGKHDGYAFSQRFGAYFSAPFNEMDPDFTFGLLWFIERNGWNSEDFVFFPNYGDFALVRSVQTAGAVLTSSKLGMGIAGGIQYYNPEFVSHYYEPETDTLYGFGHIFAGPVALQGSFNSDGWKSARASLHLESKEVNGGARSGFKTYLPNFDVAVYRDASDSVRVKWEQNLYSQLLYAEVTGFLSDYGLYSAGLKYYPDPSRIASFDFTCYRDSDGDLNFGGGVSIFMVRFAYNHAEDHERLFGAKRTFVMELNMALGAKDGNFFSRGAARPAPVEETPLTKSLDRESSKAKMERAAGKDGAVKEITATGIRREKK